MLSFCFLIFTFVIFVLYLIAPLHFNRAIEKGRNLEDSNLDKIIIFSLIRFRKICTIQLSTELLYKPGSEIKKRLEYLVDRGFVKLSKKGIPEVSEDMWVLNI